ncbi:hypothetical protein SLEP1_g13339 [Rubroshorea leprosula]|uniref:Uncharacterized protein n=1 Tax=Rubroshorea leprosula TaxID=152421 RepID=A0AAV5IPL8_9ROSI|nr:hypothetical protein SLEP1_g13339 [Rubroshorea leprosula]
MGTNGSPYGGTGGDHDPADILEGSLEDQTVDGRDENPFHDAGAANQAGRGGLEERLTHALDMNGVRINKEDEDFHGKMYAEDLD